MKKLIFLPLILTLALIVSCRKKELPKPEPAPPVFYLDGNVDGQQLNFGAGNDEYYMYSSNSRDTSNIRVFSGELKQASCPGSCGYKLAIRIKDTQTSTNSDPVDINVALKPGFYAYDNYNQEPLEYTAHFKPELDIDPSGSYTWTVNDGKSAAIISQAYEFDAILKANSVYTVSLGYSDASGCTTTHTNIFKPSARLHVNILAVKNATAPSPSYSFSCTNAGVTCHWQWGDGQDSWGWKNSHAYAPKLGYYTATLTATKGLDTSIVYYQIPGVTDPLCLANFNAGFAPIPVPQAFSRVTVDLTDPAGSVFTTGSVVQPATSVFEILSNEPYKVNEKGEETRKLMVTFSCQLRNGSRQMSLTGARAVIAVSYK